MKANKYVLATHGVDSDGDFATKYVKVSSDHVLISIRTVVTLFLLIRNLLPLNSFQGDIMATAGGGSAVVFNEVEKLKFSEPGVR